MVLAKDRLPKNSRDNMVLAKDRLPKNSRNIWCLEKRSLTQDFKIYLRRIQEFGQDRDEDILDRC